MQQPSEQWEKPCFAISVAAELVALHPQTLRRYEDLGLINPSRRAGRRLYSPREIELLRYISRLSSELGLNLAGVEVIIRLNERIRELQAELDQQSAARTVLEAQVAALKDQSFSINA
jgi:MerR family transcriptional regulator, heat shock protein HspR